MRGGKETVSVRRDTEENDAAYSSTHRRSNNCQCLSGIRSCNSTQWRDATELWVYLEQRLVDQLGDETLADFLQAMEQQKSNEDSLV